MKKLPVILIISGILIVLAPLAGQLYTQYKENKLIVEWLESSTIDASELETDIDPEEAYAQLQDSFAAENVAQTDDGSETVSAAIDGSTDDTAVTSPAKTKPKAKPAVEQTALGVITISKIKVKYPIVEGVKEENLRAGIGHIPGTAAPGQPGNSALAGHRNYTFGRFFNRLDEIEIDDKIMISTKQGDFRYVVYEKFVVTPDDVSVLKGSKDDNIITLITCTPIYIATHRLIIKARLESQTAIDP